LASDNGAGSEVVNVDSTVGAAVRLAAPTADARGVTLHIEGLSGGASVIGNTADLEHILLNLVMNAIEASPAGTTIRILCEGTNPVHVRVADMGPGIPVEDQLRIFDPFCSLRPGGTGLGLYLARNFARRWGADITVESTPGAGATFAITWPAAQAAIAEQKSA
jgi:signal transduction histidine kinase